MARSAAQPLDVLLADMRYWDDLAAAIETARGKLVISDDFPRRRAEFKHLTRQLHLALKNSGRYAVLAAPYVHPKPKRIPPTPVPDKGTQAGLEEFLRALRFRK